MDFAALFARLQAHPVARRLGWLGFLSLVAALTLTGYLFGLRDGFFGRWFFTTLVFWLLLAGTAYGVWPATRWLTGPLVDRLPPARQPRPRQPAPRRAPPPAGTPKRPAGRPGPNKWQ